MIGTGSTKVNRLLDMGYASPRIGQDGALHTNRMSGQFYEQVMRGNGYAFSTALAGVNGSAPATANGPAIWNPPWSNRIISIIKVVFARTAKGTPLEGTWVYTRLQNVNSRLSSGGDLVSGTAAAAVNLRSDLGDQSGVVFIPASANTTTSRSLLSVAGIAQNATSGDGTKIGPQTQTAIDYLDGLIAIGPGTLFSMANTATISTTYTITIYALSLPMPLIAN